MDISASTAPRTDQQNYDNYLAGPKTVTISEVKAGTAEQPIEIHLVEFPGQPYKPSKSMRRVLLSAWGADGSTYAGRKITLYGDPTVRFGSAVVGGLKISHLSHLDKPHKIALTVSRGKREQFVVQPLPTEAPSAPTLPAEAIADWVTSFKDAADITALAGLWKEAVAQGVATNAEILAAKDARKAELS